MEVTVSTIRIIIDSLCSQIIRGSLNLQDIRSNTYEYMYIQQIISYVSLLLSKTDDLMKKLDSKTSLFTCSLENSLCHCSKTCDMASTCHQLFSICHQVQVGKFYEFLKNSGPKFGSKFSFFFLFLTKEDEEEK